MTEYHRARVTYNYFPEDTSQVGLEVGQMLTVYYKDESGWWDGVNEATGERGIFPSTYVEEVIDYEPMPGEFGVDFASGPVEKEMRTKEPNIAGFGLGFGSPGETDSLQPLMTMGEKKMMKKDVNPGEAFGIQDQYKKTSTRYGIWGSNMSKFAGFGIFFSSIGALVGFGEGINFNLFQIIVFIIGIVYGGAVYLVESTVTERSPSRMPTRAIFYAISPIIFLTNLYTLFAGLLLMASAIPHYISTKRGEAIKLPPKQSHGGSKNPIKGLFGYYNSKKREGKLGKVAFILLWTAINVYVFLDTLFWWYAEVAARMAGQADDPADNLLPFTFYLPWARAFGTGLNLAGTVILLPVSRTFIRKLYDLSTQNQSTKSTLIRKALWLFPIDRAIHFHEKTGWLVLFYAFGHTFAHLVNAGLTWQQVIVFYGWSPLITGFLLWAVMFPMYTSVEKNVKRGHFELFWYSHQLFALFFFLCLIHGRGSFGPNYWKWFIVPGSIYLAERIYREYSAYQTVALLSVTNMKDSVYRLEFSKAAFPNGYKEGQYVYLNSPFVSKGQWHPFTISSAPQDDTVTLHIKAQGKTSWTRGLLEHLSLLGPRGASYFELSDQRADGVVMGKSIGPSGEKLLRLYGPHSAPTQHVPEYSTDIIVGSGIGVTPVCSTLQSIVYHRWKFNIGSSYPDHVYFGWVASYKEVDNFRWFIRILKNCQDEVNDMKVKNPDLLRAKTFEFHLFITSVPKDAVAPGHVEIEDDTAFWGTPRKDQKNIDKAPSPFTELDLYRAMKAPPKEGVQLGDVHVYNGRPKWDNLFSVVAEKHIATKIGVAFCGNPRIGSDLKGMCKKYTDLKRKQFFVFHKETF